MKSIKYHLPPNIVTGTNFNVSRFQELYSWIEACRADALSLNLPTYGLLCDEKGHAVFDLQVHDHKIQLTQCFAITKGGVPLSVLPENTEALQLDITQSHFLDHDTMDLLLVTNLKGKRQSTGHPDGNEIPLRAPFSMLPYRLELHPPDTLDGMGDFLKIGEVRTIDGKPTLSNYIPACAQIGAHPVMKERIFLYQQQLTAFYQAIKLIVKNVDPAKEKSVIVSLAKLCREMGEFLAAYIPTIKATNAFSCPKDFYDLILAFAERIDFEWQVNSRHTEMLELIQYNVRNSTNNFDFRILDDFSNHIPEETDMLQTLNLIEQFMNEFALPIISISSQSRIMVKQEQSVWEEKKSVDRNMW